MYPGVGAFVLIRPAQTFYERINIPHDQILTLGDVGPDEPVKKIKRFQPLADYLAERLEALGIQGGEVVIARDLDEMARFLQDGTVDIYFDSAYPTLAVQEAAGSEIILRRWKQEDPTYWSGFVARKNSGLSGIHDFLGKVIAFEEPFSTSGFVLPAGTLIQRGYAIKQVERPDAQVSADEIGYFFSWDEENTIEMVLLGLVAGGGISNQDYEGLPTELKEQLMTLEVTISVPRQLASVRPGLGPDPVSKLGGLLSGLHQTQEGQVILANIKGTKQFDALPAVDDASLRDLSLLMNLVSGV